MKKLTFAPIFFFLFFSTHVLALTFMDDFSGSTINTSWWTVASNGNSVVLDTTNQRVVQTQNTQNGTSALNFNKVQIIGDFDAQVDYTILNYPGYGSYGNQERIGLGAYPDIGLVERISDGYFGGEVYLTHFLPYLPAPWPGDATTDVSGKFRLVRTGNTITAYYWKNSAWKLLHSKTNTSYGNPVDVINLPIFSGYSSGGLQIGMQIAFDNFYLNAPDTPFPHKDLYFPLIIKRD